jgi:hypothetical protein
MKTSKEIADAVEEFDEGIVACTYTLRSLVQRGIVRCQIIKMKNEEKDILRGEHRCQQRSLLLVGMAPSEESIKI